MLRVEEVNSIADLTSLQLAWQALLEQTRGATFFQSLDWLRSYWMHFGHSQQLRVLAVFHGKEPIGIVPLTVIHEKTKIGTVRVLTYPLSDWATYYGPIGPNPTATLVCTMRHLAAQEPEFDLLDLRWINRNELDRGRTARAMQQAGFQAWEGPWKTTAVVDLRQSWDAYLTSRTSKFRNNLRRAELRAAKEGDLQLERFRPGVTHQDIDPRWNLFEETTKIARKSWQGSSRTGTTLSHESVHSFFRNTHGSAAAAGAVDVNVLRLDGRPIAFSYNYHHQGYLTGIRMGYDPQFSELSPGMLLLARMLQDSINRNDRQLDMGSESLDIKRHWITGTETSCRCTHYRLGSTRSQLLRCKRWLACRYGLGSAA